MTGLGEKHRHDGFVKRSFLEPKTPRGRSRLSIEDVSGSCTYPVIVRKETYVDQEYHVRCRRCPGCLRARQYLWRLRAEAEFLISPQTVFFTGTFRDQSHAIEDCNEEVTKWLKRCRYYLYKQHESVRYIVIPERHKSGAWHVHALMHTDRNIPKSLYEDSWSAGWNWAKFADITTATYVTKYVAKNMLDDAEAKVPRIRASRNPSYGGWVIQKDKEELMKLLKAKGDECPYEIWTKNLRHLLRDLQTTTTSTNLEDLVAVQMEATKQSRRA